MCGNDYIIPYVSMYKLTLLGPIKVSPKLLLQSVDEDC